MCIYCRDPRPIPPSTIATHPDRPNLSGAVQGIPDRADDTLFAHWQRLVDARLIGNVQEIGAESRANIARTEAAIGARAWRRRW